MQSETTGGLAGGVGREAYRDPFGGIGSSITGIPAPELPTAHIVAPGGHGIHVQGWETPAAVAIRGSGTPVAALKLREVETNTLWASGKPRTPIIRQFAEALTIWVFVPPIVIDFIPT